MKFTLYDVAQSLLPEDLGVCRSDFTRLSAIVNAAQLRLIQAGSETGWFGSWAKVVFNVDREDPYITLPSQFARIANMDVCQFPVRVQNEWYEFLEAGIGLQKNFFSTCNWPGLTDAYDRNNVPSAYEIPDSNQKLRVYITDTRDIGAKFFVNGALDSNGNKIYSQDVTTQVEGEILILDDPFVTTTDIITSFSSITKQGTAGQSATYGDVVFKAVDATTGDETFLSRYGAQETTPQYRRYYINALPLNCCCSANGTTAQVTVMCKYEYRPVVNPSDVLIIGNIEALREECMSIRYGKMDNAEAQAFSVLKHKEAIRLLNNDLAHYVGKLQPAINFAPFNTANLGRQAIGTLV